MLVAEIIILCVALVSDVHLDKQRDCAYPVLWLLRLLETLHDAALLVGNVADPVRLARRNEHMGAPPLDEAVELVLRLNLEAAGVLDVARVAVVGALFAVDGGVRLGEQLIHGRRARCAERQLLGAIE